MKKTIVLLTIYSLLTITGCKKDKTVVVTETETPNSNTFSVIGETSVVKWTAYKTTDKIAVKGKFNDINVTNSKQAKTIEEALNGILFSIPVSSIFSNETTRDNKLKEFFFGAMKNTEFISGTFDVNEKGSFANIILNGVSKTIPIELNIDGQTVKFKNTLNLNDWNLADAVASLNKVCLDLHKGADGISKTWDEVEIEAVIYLKVNN
jgi:hypothetical protein